MFSILVVEDDKNLNRILATKLRQEDFKVSCAFDGQEALKIMESEYIDLIISDIMMPRMNGYELTRLLRDTSCVIPVLMVTAKDQIEDMEKGFMAGTDDYMIKPINLEEMVLRVKALLRRSQLANKKKIAFKNTVLDYESLSVTSNGKTICLPPKEFLLLFKLLNTPNKIFTRLEILDEIWSMEEDVDERNVDAHIKKLRKKFEDNTDFEIVTVRGIGYKARYKE